jgi:hypothetical protein
MRRTGCLVLVLALGACGVRADLKPQANKALPPPAYGASDRPTSAQLLKPVPQAAPVRSFELRQRSEERADDPYDLPPAE